MSDILLTRENYHSTEMNLKYTGSSQFKTFMDCEARGLAEVQGLYKQESTTALLVGGYVDAHFEQTLDVFMAQNPDIFTAKGTLKAPYEHANVIIQRIERDPLFMLFMSGEKQKILTGTIMGVPVKIRIDSYLTAEIGKLIMQEFPNITGLENGATVDLKCMKDFDTIWVPDEGRVSFVEAWGYDIQAAIYQYIEMQNRGDYADTLPFFIAGATKEKPEPDINIISIPQERLDYCMSDIIKPNIVRFDDLKQGLFEPIRCGKCDWCRQNKVLTGIIDYGELG